ncbi:MAG: response regulator [Acidobacteriia bacterium]|nr:response regulator [Terriglobia bacterium]
MAALQSFRPNPLRTNDTVVVLSVSPLEETHSRLRSVLQHTNWAMIESHECCEAIQVLHQNSLAVVVCERDLPDGTWLDLLNQAEALPSPPLIIVTARDADEQLWGEVLNLGGYDVLPKPLDSVEVTRVISLAWRHWQQKWSIAGKPADAATGAVVQSATA